MVSSKKSQPYRKALKRINPLENEFNLWNLALLLVTRIVKRRKQKEGQQQLLSTQSLLIQKTMTDNVMIDENFNGSAVDNGNE